MKITTSGRVASRPVRRHAVARQVLRHEVQQADHRRRAREPQNRHGAHVVNGAERLAEMLVRQVGERAAVRLRRPAGTPARDERASSRRCCPPACTLMMTAAVVSSFCVFRMRP